MGLSHMAHTLPEPVAVRLGDIMGDTLFRCSARYRQVALKNLRWAFREEWTEDQIHRAARETFRNFGRSAVEFLRMPVMSDDEVRRKTEYDGKEHLLDALALGKGVLLATAHFGNWEIMGARFALDGYTLHVVSRDADDEGVNRLTNRIREKRGYHVLSRDKSVKPILAALRRNEFIGILNDQNYTTGIFVPFFGKLAATATGTATLARSTGAPVLPCYSIRQPDNTHRLLIRPPLPFERSEDKEADLAQFTARITADIEEMVRLYPTQWMWIHDRWKHRPPVERGVWCEEGEAKREESGT